jgi:hypothetical protein
MARLEEEAREAKEERVEDGVPTAETVRHLRNLGATRQFADGGEGRTMLAEALFERIESPGRSDSISPTRPSRTTSRP